ncbi:MAG: hypothetical protein ACFB51_03955, partial [Anaerolineae bacterium]
EPPEVFFPTRQAIFPTYQPARGFRNLNVTAKWVGGAVPDVIAGQIKLTDHTDREYTFFTFGGDLTIEHEELPVVCTLSSQAPIIFLEGVRAAAFAKLEALLSRQHADQSAYHDALAGADPLHLYAVGLKAVQAAFEADSTAQDRDAVIAYLEEELEHAADLVDSDVMERDIGDVL